MAKKNRTQEELKESTASRLKAYATAAAAAAGVLLTAGPAEAGIVYTPLDISVPVNGEASLSINGANFTFENMYFLHCVLSSSCGRGFSSFAQIRVLGESVLVTGPRRFGSIVDPLQYGGAIGPAQGPFASAGDLDTVSCPAFSDCEVYGSFGSGNFMGLRFAIGGGQYEYGWLALTFDYSLGSNGFGNDYADETITGYAYDTVPGQEIRAGQTTVPEPGALGLLALGALGLGVWRRKRIASQC